MANTKELRERIKSVQNTQQMTKAMKMVAAAKLRRAQDNIIRLRPYAEKLQELMDDVSSNLGSDVESPYMESRDVKKVLIIAVNSNRGLCGAFNNNINKLMIHHIEENYAEQLAGGNVSVLPIGKKAFEFAKRRNLPVIDDRNHDVYADLNFDTVNEVANHVLRGFTSGEFDKVDIIYNKFKNVVVQERTVESYLPLSGAVSGSGEEGDQKSPSHSNDYIFEPEKEEILEELIPKSLRLQLYKAVLESNAGEQGARMTAMDNATENASELLGDLRLEYNRARQSAITTEILEIVAGAEALSSD